MKKIFFFSGAPEYFESVLNLGVFKKAQDKNFVEFKVINLHEYAKDAYGSIDDYPYGGGAGMIMRPEPVFEAFEAIFKKDIPRVVILLSPKGEILTQSMLNSFSQEDCVVFICGRYKGVDERVKSLITHEISLGDYIFSSGELGALLMAEGIVRLIPGVVGDYESILEDSFMNGLLSPPCYTRPRNFRGMKVPEILLSGDHKKIYEWRKREAIKETLLKRPYLLSQISLDDEIIKTIKEVYDG